MLSAWHLLFLVALSAFDRYDRWRFHMLFGGERRAITPVVAALAAFYGVDVAHWLPNMPRGSENA